MDCLFCRLGRGEIESKKIYENEESLSFLDIYPLTPGHAVVIPKTHSKTILDLPSDKIPSLFEAVQKTAQKIQEKVNPDGFTIGMNQGEASGQTVPHLHIHIIPRWQGDGGGSVHSIVRWSNGMSVEEVLKKINS